MSKLWDSVKKYLRRYRAKPGRHRANRVEYYLNTTILDMIRNWRRSWDHIGSHRVIAGATSYAKAGAVHLGAWYDQPTAAWPIVRAAREHWGDTLVAEVAPWAPKHAGPWWSPVPVGAASILVS